MSAPRHKPKRRTTTLNDDVPKLCNLEFDERRIFSPDLKSATLEEIIVKLVLDQEGINISKYNQYHIDNQNNKMIHSLRFEIFA